MKTKFFWIVLGSLVLSACHSEDFSIHATLNSDKSFADRWCYMFASYGNQLDMLDSCKIENNAFRLVGKLPQKEVLIEVMIPDFGSYFFLAAGNERVSLTIDDNTRSFFPPCEGSYATNCMTKIAQRYREIGYGKLDSLKRRLDGLSDVDPDRINLAETIRSHERELADLVRDAILNERSLLLAATVKMWYCDPDPAISDDSMKRIVADLRRRFPDDPNLVSIDPERQTPPPTRASMEVFNLKARLTGRPLPYPKLQESEHSVSVDDAYPAYSMGDTVQPFSLTGLSGAQQNTADCKTEYMLIDFWASWCDPCCREIPSLLSAQQYFGDILTIYAVSLDDDQEVWIRAVKKYAMQSVINVRLSRDDRSFTEFVNRFGIRAIPHNFLLNLERRIIAVDLRGEELEKKMRELTDADFPSNSKKQ